jgi:hypothetical protein
MQTIIRNILTLASEPRAYITELVRAPLSGVPFHQDCDFISRLFAEHFPVHLAVHEVSPVHTPPLQYTQLHVHDDTNEINLLLSSSQLVYRIQLANDVYEVGANSSVWIPKGIQHSANVLSGEGYFVTMRF